MAKDFKYFDRLYSSYRGKFMPHEATQEQRLQESGLIIQGWTGTILNWTATEIQLAVYSSEGWQEWQKFRVSMKGQDTGLKLARLAYYQGFYNATHVWPQVKCRVDNYLNAMKRGGLLDADNKIALRHADIDLP